MASSRFCAGRASYRASKAVALDQVPAKLDCRLPHKLRIVLALAASCSTL